MILVFENMLNSHIIPLNINIRTLYEINESRSLGKTFIVFLCLLLIYYTFSFVNFDTYFTEKTVWGHALFGNNRTALNATQTQQNDNYVVDLFVNPSRPSVDRDINFTLEIKSKANDVLIELPVAAYILKDGKPVFSNPNNYTLVRQQHYDFDYTFNETGTYSLVVDIKDIFYTLDVTSFTFKIVVDGPVLDRVLNQIRNYYYIFIPTITILVIFAILAMINYRKNKIRD